MSSDACLLAFLVSDLALALGASDSMALPRLIESVPVILALRASKPPGMLKFFATCAAATHWPRFLKPLQAVCASSPVSVLIFPAIAVLWLRTSLGEACDIFELLIAPPLLDSLTLEPDAPEGPCPAGGPPPGCERCAKAGELHAKVRATTRIRYVRFTDASSILFSGLQGKAGSTDRPRRGSLLFEIGCDENGKGCKPLLQLDSNARR